MPGCRCQQQADSSGTHFYPRAGGDLAQATLPTGSPPRSGAVRPASHRMLLILRLATASSYLTHQTSTARERGRPGNNQKRRDKGPMAVATGPSRVDSTPNYCADQPPSEGRITPVRLVASSLSRKQIEAANCSGIATGGMFPNSAPMRAWPSSESKLA